MDLFAEIETKKKEKREKKKKEKKSKDKKVKPLSASNLQNTSNEANNTNVSPEEGSDLSKNLAKTLNISNNDPADDEEWLDDIGEDENAMTTSISRISKIEVAKKTKIVTKQVKQEDGTQKEEEVEVEVDEHGKALNEQFDWANAESMTSSMAEKMEKKPEEEKKPMKLSEGIPSATTGGSFMDRMKRGGAGSTPTAAPIRRRRQQQYKTEDANQFPTLGTAVQQDKGTPAGFTSVDTTRSGATGSFGARMREGRRMETSNKFGNLG